jgi:hypothetical protein
MFDALKLAAQGLPPGSEFRLHYFDQFDLFKLKSNELVARGYDQCRAEKISSDLMAQRLDELGKSLGIKLFVARDVRTLIPGEGARRAAEELRDDPQTARRCSLKWIESAIQRNCRGELSPRHGHLLRRA